MDQLPSVDSDDAMRRNETVKELRLRKIRIKLDENSIVVRL